jgi:hypothetical protein
MPSRSTVIALVALFAALGGTATAAKLINGKKIRKGTVTTRQVKDRTLTRRDLSRATIAALKGRLGPVGSEQIIDGSVALADLAPGSVDGTRVVDRSLTAGDLVTDTITSTELGTGSVGDDELGENSVGNSEIKGNAISRNQLRPSVLRAGTVTLTLGDVPAGGCAQQTAAGAANQIPAGAFTNTAILIGAPAALPDGLEVSGRSPDGNDLRIQACNHTNATVGLGELAFPYTAFGT